MLRVTIAKHQESTRAHQWIIGCVDPTHPRIHPAIHLAFLCCMLAALHFLALRHTHVRVCASRLSFATPCCVDRYVCHELRNPLHVLKAAVASLLERPQDVAIAAFSSSGAAEGASAGTRDGALGLRAVHAAHRVHHVPNCAFCIHCTGSRGTLALCETQLLRAQPSRHMRTELGGLVALFLCSCSFWCCAFVFPGGSRSPFPAIVQASRVCPHACGLPPPPPPPSCYCQGSTYRDWTA